MDGGRRGRATKRFCFVFGHLIGLLLDSRLANDLMGHTEQSVVVIPERQAGLWREKVTAGNGKKSFDYVSVCKDETVTNGGVTL